jgi:hypothetical protein
LKRLKLARKTLPECGFGAYDIDYENNCIIRTVTDLDECQEVWRAVIPTEYITDLWEVRACFQQHFKRPSIFMVVEDNDGISGLLPLSFIDEHRCYGYFPGETWHGKTWLEQNRIYFRSLGPKALLSRFDLPYHLRYLSAQNALPDNELMIDEIGYLFSPPQYDYDLKNYFAGFSHKSIKQILREIDSIEKLGISYRYDDISDFDLMIRMSISRFGVDSYFYDPRFREGFRSLAYFLRGKGWLRFTTVLINHEPAAVDMGCMYNGVYTLLAGGTDSRFPGVAKLINLHHMERACREGIRQVDFLCGDFNWKKLFHLTARPLFLLTNQPVDVSQLVSSGLSFQPANV